MALRLQPYSTVSRRLLNDAARGRRCFLIGAGVSMLRPTHLPSGWELRDMVIAGCRLWTRYGSVLASPATFGAIQLVATKSRSETSAGANPITGMTATHPTNRATGGRRQSPR